MFYLLNNTYGIWNFSYALYHFQNKDMESKMQEMKANLGEEIKKITQESVQHFQVKNIVM